MKQISYHNYHDTIKSIAVEKLPEILQEGHKFFLEAQDYYQKEKTVKEAVDLYIEKLNVYLKNQSSKNSKGSENTDLYFIKKFVEMHNSTLGKFQLKKYISKLQQAITTKQILKSSPVASHIQEIQEKLIRQYNLLPEKGKITIAINSQWLTKLKSLVIPTQDLLSGIITNEATEQSLNPLRPKGTNNTSELFEPMDNINKEVNSNTFRLENGFNEFLGDLERFELAITIEGEQGSGKTRFTYQLANAFANLRHQIAIFSLEIGSKSDLIRRMKEDYLEAQNHSNVFIADTLPKGIESIKEAASQFDVIIIDSWNKVGVPSLEFDSLRKQFPNTIFIVIFQRTTQKTIRGGTAPLYDAGINIEVVKADDSFKNNYAVTTKNRYGVTGVQYNIYTQKVLNGIEKEKTEEIEFEILNEET